MFPPAGDNGFVTVEALMSAMPRFALPHFQRGQVWRGDSISLLFESLMLDTPCGSIILWVPPGPVLDFGEPVDAWGTAQPDFLVVDGQQRLTALGLVLGSGQRWALNLAAVPAFWDAADVRPERRHRARPLFVPFPDEPTSRASDRRRAIHVANLRDLVALDEIERSGVAAWPYSARPAGSDVAALWESMSDGIRAIRTRRLQLVVKRREPLRAIVELYNRINSAGVTVRQEEKSFAAMVAFEPGAASWLRDCFAETHPHRVRGADPATLAHSTVVNREREQRFGFPLVHPHVRPDRFPPHGPGRRRPRRTACALGRSESGCRRARPAARCSTSRAGSWPPPAGSCVRSCAVTTTGSCRPPSRSGR